MLLQRYIASFLVVTLTFCAPASALAVTSGWELIAPSMGTGAQLSDEVFEFPSGEVPLTGYTVQRHGGGYFKDIPGYSPSSVKTSVLPGPFGAMSIESPATYAGSASLVVILTANVAFSAGGGGAVGYAGVQPNGSVLNGTLTPIRRQSTGMALPSGWNSTWFTTPWNGKLIDMPGRTFPSVAFSELSRLSTLHTYAYVVYVHRESEDYPGWWEWDMYHGYSDRGYATQSHNAGMTPGIPVVPPFRIEANPAHIDQRHCFAPDDGVWIDATTWGSKSWAYNDSATFSGQYSITPGVVDSVVSMLPSPGVSWDPSPGSITTTPTPNDPGTWDFGTSRWEEWFAEYVTEPLTRAGSQLAHFVAPVTIYNDFMGE